VGGVRRFREELAGSRDDAIRPKKGERPNSPGTRPDASGGPRITHPFVESVKSPWHVRRLLAAIQRDGDGHDRECGGQAYWPGRSAVSVDLGRERVLF
jgi:hypothetical protein